MKEVQDRVVQFSNRYKLTNAETGEVLGTFDFDEVTGTVQQVGTEIDKELFDSIANDLAARVVSNGGELSGTIVTFSDISGTAANVASGDTSATLWGKVKNWFSRLKALAFKDKVSNTDVADDAAIAQSKISGLADSLNGKQPTITGGASTIASKDLTANRALVSDANGKVAVSDVTSTELGYLDGVTSNIQTQLNNSGKITSRGGFQGGTGASATAGAAIGNGASATAGAAIGNGAKAYGGGAIGSSARETSGGGAVGIAANTQSGGAIGSAASATTGGAIGSAASATTGFAGGENAKATASGAVQLGKGTNENENTLQFREYQIVDENGLIPAARLSNIQVPVTSVNGKTGAVTLAKSDVGLGNVDNTSDKDKPISTAMQTAVNNVSMVPYGGQATTLSSLGSGGVYSISANGFLRIAYQTTAADNFISMKQVSSSGADIWGFLANGQKSYGNGYPYIYMPVANGDHIKVDFSSSVKIIQVQLIKVKTV